MSILCLFNIVLVFSISSALTPLQLEKKLNTKINQNKAHFEQEYKDLCKKYQDLKTLTDKNAEILNKNFAKIEENYKTVDQRIKGLEESVGLPVGYTYIQLPDTLPPDKLWAHLKWIEITEKYAGLFFRAEGGMSMPFGHIQPANYSWISNMHSVSYWYDSWQGIHGTGTYHSQLNMGKWSMNANPSTGLIRSLYFYLTSGENRPKNTAIKIWQHIH